MRKGLSAAFLASAGLAPLAALAADKAASTVRICDTTGYKPLEGLLAGISAECGACGQCQIYDFFIVGNSIAKLILGLSGSIMLLMVVYGGFLWLVSSGNSSLVEKGKKILIGSVIGLIIVFGAYTATQFILGSLGVANVAEIFQRPFLNTKGKVVETAGGSATASPDAPKTCACRFSLNNSQECIAIVSLLGSQSVECTTKSNGCECESKVSVTDNSQCNFDNSIKTAAPNAVGSCSAQ